MKLNAWNVLTCNGKHCSVMACGVESLHLTFELRLNQNFVSHPKRYFEDYLVNCMHCECCLDSFLLPQMFSCQVKHAEIVEKKEILIAVLTWEERGTGNCIIFIFLDSCLIILSLVVILGS